MIRRIVISLAVGVMAAFAIGLHPESTVAQTTAQPDPQQDQRPTISVVGNGRILTQPDIAYVNLGVDANGATFAEAQANTSSQMQAVIDTLVGLGISRDDIRTSRLAANPVYDQRDNTVIRGYRATNNVQVKLRDLDRVGATVDAVTAAGANRVDGVTFAIENQDASKSQARAQAMQAARAKADQLASLAGMRVVSVKSIQEGDATATPVRAAPQAMAAAPGAVPTPPVEPGTQEVQTQVTVTYVVE